MYQTIRQYFDQSQMLEVEVPLLGIAATTDPHINSLAVQTSAGSRYLQSSPEFFLKRLLVGIQRSCFCITKAFRDEEHGKNHNPEFSMLEWYRVGFDLDAIIDESLELIQLCLPGHQQVVRETYKSLFLRHLNINPHTVELAQLQPLVAQHSSYEKPCESVSEALQILLSSVIEPRFSGLTVVAEFPAAQAALARLDLDRSGQLVAQRFEIYLDQLELVNGYHELLDAEEQRRRFEFDNQQRQKMGRPQMQFDEALLGALQQGLPDCSGVSIGLDRLLMARLGLNRIEDVLLFPWSRA